MQPGSFNSLKLLDLGVHPTFVVPAISATFTTAPEGFGVEKTGGAATMETTAAAVATTGVAATAISGVPGAAAWTVPVAAALLNAVAAASIASFGSFSSSNSSSSSNNRRNLDGFRVYLVFVVVVDQVGVGHTTVVLCHCCFLCGNGQTTEVVEGGAVGVERTIAAGVGGVKARTSAGTS